jgi:hypothetical protein
LIPLAPDFNRVSGIERKFQPLQQFLERTKSIRLLGKSSKCHLVNNFLDSSLALFKETPDS